MAQDKCRAAPRVLRRRILRNGLNSWDGLERPRGRLMLAWGIAPGLIRNQKTLGAESAIQFWCRLDPINGRNARPQTETRFQRFVYVTI